MALRVDAIVAAVLALATCGTVLVAGCAGRPAATVTVPRPTAVAPRYPRTATYTPEPARASYREWSAGAYGISLDVRGQRSNDGVVALGFSVFGPGEMQLVIEKPGMTVDAQLSPRGLERVYTENPADSNGSGPGVERLTGRGGGARFTIPKDAKVLVVHAHVRLVSLPKDADLTLTIPVPSLPVVEHPDPNGVSPMGISPSF